ncbi:glycosyltransferase family 2 protein [Phenylobacterium sp. 20VBR1]|uniref:Glycosyltransferase family 2 protein n=1 Tax=Phenylobacterium glaciei TaxID=2803784 RepID=A0A941D2B5_9CAUL|nr:glycosyltransferase family 2 protein [Phenylobacterium glaciei]MBR7620980.1 glycosyltransferase family 2 protein [Phenylobacterium glaciei]
MTRLALVMIARDEAHQIARALKSAKPFVDAMIVLDTGSVDGTQAIARACGAEVHDFAWCDDFAAARNASLALSPADWNLVLDADEWIESGGEALAELEPDAMGWVRRDNQLEDEAVSQTWIPRVLPKGVRYEGRIHEQPVGLERGVRLPVLLGHDGFTAESLARKGDRNEVLLMADLQDHPQDPYLWFQLAKEHQVRGHPPQAALCFTEALRLAPSGAPWRHSLVVRGLTALKDAGRLEEARALAEAERDAWDGSPDFHFAVGNLYLDCAMADPERAVSDLLPVAEAAWKRCLEIGEQPHLDGAVRGRGSFMAAHNLTTLYETFGPPEAAATYRVLAARR